MLVWDAKSLVGTHDEQTNDPGHGEGVERRNNELENKLDQWWLGTFLEELPPS